MMSKKQIQRALMGMVAMALGCDDTVERPGPDRAEAELSMGAGETTLDSDRNGCGSIYGDGDPTTCPGAMDALHAVFACFCAECAECAYICAPPEHNGPPDSQLEACQACVSASEVDGTCTAVVEACVSDKRVKADPTSD
jgi:hypothetical protein